VFDADAASPQTPSPIVVRQVIGTDAPAFSYWALDAAPKAALSNIDAETGFLAGLSRRLRPIWPELARTMIAEVPAEPRSVAGSRRRQPRRREVPLPELEARSNYDGPGPDAVHGEPPDEG
jgi:hypothetical protein